MRWSLIAILLVLRAPELRADDDAELADDTYQKASTNLDEAKSGLDHERLDDATAAAAKCVDRITSALRDHPKLATRTIEDGGKHTLGELRDRCRAVTDEIAKANAGAASGKANDIQTVVTKSYAAGVQELAAARKAKHAKHFSDAVESYKLADARFEAIDDTIKSAIEKHADLATSSVTVGKAKRKAKDLLDEVEHTRAQLQTEQAGVADAARKESDASDSALLSGLKGDRKRVAGDNGLPSWFDGADLSGMKNRVKAIQRAGTWRYDSSTGCKETFHFHGNKLTGSTTQPHGCSR